jgi:hypothetical protein
VQSRRDFLKYSSTAAGLGLLGVKGIAAQTEKKQKSTTPITIAKVDANFERESLIRPFGFKGGYMTEIWQSVAFLQSDKGTKSVGLCTQNVLWSDARVFASHSESGSNALMYKLSEHALQLVKGISFKTPINLLDKILDEVYHYGQRITGNNNLRKTFALNALVGVDNAAWILYARENNRNNFDGLIPADYKPAFSHQHKQ